MRECSRDDVLPRPGTGHDQARVVGVDVARALALFGMMATHLLVPVQADQVTWYQQLAGGRSAALFAVLAGVSVSLVTGGTRAVVGAERTARVSGLVVRALFLAYVGMLLGPLDTPIAVILTYYGVLFLLGLPFVGLGWRALAAWAGVWTVAAPVLSHLLRPALVSGIPTNPTVDRLTDEPGRLLTELTFTGYYPAVPWMAYLLAGMAVGRCVLTSRRTAATLMIVGAGLAASSWGLSWWLRNRRGGLEVLTTSSPLGGDRLELELVLGLHGTTPTTSWWWLTVSSPHSGTPFDLAHTIGTSLLVLGTCLLLGQLAGRLLRWVFAAGTMTLSLYTAHVVALHLRLGPDRDSADLYVTHVTTSLVVAAAWYAVVGRGPLEWFTRRLSWIASRSLPGLVHGRS